MRKLVVFALLAYSILFAIGCKEKPYYNDCKIKTIAKPKSLALKRFGDDFNGEQFPKNGYTYELVARINGDCMPCIMEMGGWQVFHQKVALPYGVRLTFYVYCNIDYNRFNKNMQNVLYSGLPIYQDSTDSFLKLNGLDPYNDPNCFLLRNDTVIFTGNPVRNKDSFNRVMEILKKEGAKYDDLTLDF